MKINRIQYSNNIQKTTEPKTIYGSEMPCDSVSFTSQKDKNESTHLDKIKGFFTQGIKNVYNSVCAGFEEHFFTLKKSVVNEIALTEEQKKLLNKRITDFENYKSTLSDTELKELEKNKHGLLDFSIKNGLPDTKLTGYNAFLDRYETFKNGDYAGITNEELAQLIYYTDITDLISDGKIGSFGQGRTGDCWFLSMLGNYASTPEGEANIEKRISPPDENGTYTVTFDDFFDPSKKQIYTITQKELQDYDLLSEDSMFSSGDLDVRILEIATGKMLNQYILPMEKFSFYRQEDDNDVFGELKKLTKEYSPSQCIAEGYLEKQMLVHRALGYKNNIIKYMKRPEGYDDIQNRPDDYISKELTENTNAKIFAVELELTQENGKIKFIPKVTPTEYGSLTEVANKNGFCTSELIASSSHINYSDDDKENRYISTGHVFNIMESEQKDGISVNDPYNSAFPHTISKKDFDRVFNSLIYIPTK